MGELIAILSGKGGTGKTSVCAGLGQALAHRGETVLCIDCDVGLRNLDIALGLSQLPSLSFLDVCENGCSIEQATAHPTVPGLFFLTAPATCTAQDIDPLAFAELLDQARGRYTYVLLDAPAGLDAGFDLAARFADRILLVTGSDPAAVRDAGRAGEVLERMGKTNVRLIVNRVRKKALATMNLTVDDIMDQAGLPLIGLIPEDPNVTLAAAFTQPLLHYTRRGAAQAMIRIAKRIQGLKVQVKI